MSTSPRARPRGADRERDRDRERTRLDGWPTERAFYLTLDLEADYAGLVPDAYEAARRVDRLVDVVAAHDVPLSVFVQTAVIEAAPRAIRRLRDAPVPVEFHAHTHTHPQRADADVPAEVAQSVALVRDRFDTDPLGFRFPEGIVRPGDYDVLAANDVDFDASLFPSIRPGIAASINGFDNTDEPRYPFRDRRSGVVELPLTVQSRRVPIPVSLSYLKLLGRPFEWLVRARPPTVIHFDCHMHDLVVPSAYADLPPAYRLIYARNRDGGAATLSRVLAAAARRGYEFGLVSELYDATVRELGDRTDGAADDGDG